MSACDFLAPRDLASFGGLTSCLAQLTPSGWTYNLASMVLLSQTGLYWQSMPGEMNYLLSLVTQKRYEGLYIVKPMPKLSIGAQYCEELTRS